MRTRICDVTGVDPDGRAASGDVNLPDISEYKFPCGGAMPNSDSNSSNNGGVLLFVANYTNALMSS